MKEKFLPIGTVVYLKDKKRKVMITSYLIFSKGDDEEKTVYDYGASVFPEGIIDSNYSFAFNHDDISEVVYMGLEDDDYKKLNDMLKQSEQELRDKLSKNEM